MSTLKDRTLFITGASRGIGKAIGLRAAADGANVVIAAKTDQPHPKLPGTIHTAAAEMEAAGGRALALKVDIRDDQAVADAVARAADHFGGIDIVVNNASAIQLTGTADTSLKRFDRMFDVNVRGTFAVTRACLPDLQASSHAHVLNLAPPPSLDPKWWAPHFAYTYTKMGMSFCVLALADEFRGDRIAVNALWPATLIATEALRMLPGDIRPENCRRPEVVADAAHAILVRNPSEDTGQFFLDEDVLKSEGVQDLSPYAVADGAPLIPDLFLESSHPNPGTDTDTGTGPGSRGGQSRQSHGGTA